MNTPTPETDAILSKGGTYTELLIHSRELERERNQLRTVADSLAATLKEIDDLWGAIQADTKISNALGDYNKLKGTQ